MRTRNVDWFSVSIIAFIIFCVLSMLSLIVFSIAAAFHSEPGRFTVTGKEAVKSDKSSTYLIFTDVTTYEVDDSLVYWRFDSSDVYGKIQIGKTYTATLQGYRIPFLSMYQNLIDLKEVPNPQKVE